MFQAKFDAGMEAWHVQSNKKVKSFTAYSRLWLSERQIVDKAYAGDIIGIFDPGTFAIGDTLCSSKDKFAFEGIPTFPPEHFARVKSA